MRVKCCGTTLPNMFRPFSQLARRSVRRRGVRQLHLVLNHRVRGMKQRCVLAEGYAGPGSAAPEPLRTQRDAAHQRDVQPADPRGKVRRFRVDPPPWCRTVACHRAGTWLSSASASHLFQWRRPWSKRCGRTPTRRTIYPSRCVPRKRDGRAAMQAPTPTPRPVGPAPAAGASRSVHAGHDGHRRAHGGRRARGPRFKGAALPDPALLPGGAAAAKPVLGLVRPAGAPPPPSAA